MAASSWIAELAATGILRPEQCLLLRAVRPLLCAGTARVLRPLSGTAVEVAQGLHCLPGQAVQPTSLGVKKKEPHAEAPLIFLLKIS